MLPTKFRFISEEKIFRNRQSVTRIACLLTNWDTMSNLYRGPFIDASYQVSFHLIGVYNLIEVISNEPNK